MPIDPTSHPAGQTPLADPPAVGTGEVAAAAQREPTAAVVAADSGRAPEKEAESAPDVAPAEISGQVPADAPADAPAEAPAAAEAAAEPATEPPGLTPDNASAHSVNAMSGYSIGLSVDTDTSDADSSLGDIGIQSSSRSVNSTIYQFVEEFGRTFHRYKEGKYYLPNDEQEQNRLDLQHAIAKQLLGGKLGLAPVPTETHRVLDIGTGTGIWAIDFAEEYPTADVLGTDLSPIQPEYIPPNCRFEIDDADDEWAWSQSFDYIHGRYIVPFLRDVPGVIQKAYDNLCAGGHFELFEGPMLFQAVDGSLEGTVVKEWNEHMMTGVRRIGRDPLAALQLRRWMEEAGFVNITERRFALPINPWPRGRENKLLGAMEMTNLLEVAHGITSAVFTKALGWAVEEVEVFLAKVRRDLKDRRIHAYLPVIAIYGQKPEQN